MIKMDLNQFVLDKRNTSGFGSICKSCEKLRSKKKYLKNRNKRLKQIAKWAKYNPDKRKEIEKRYAKSEKRKSYIREWQLGEKYKSYQREYSKKQKRLLKKEEYRRNNPAKLVFLARKRQMNKRNASPKWLNKEQQKKIESFYLDAYKLTKKTKIPHEVDHIIPIQGKNVMGLHVPWNLRVVPRSINRMKSNSVIL